MTRGRRERVDHRSCRRPLRARPALSRFPARAGPGSEHGRARLRAQGGGAIRREMATRTALDPARRRPRTSVPPVAPTVRKVSWISTASTARWVSLAGTEPSGSSSRRSARNAAAARTASCSARVALGRMGEPPSARPLGEADLVPVGQLDARGGEDAAVVGPAGSRPDLVDGAGSVDEHRAVPPVVVAEQHVPGGPAGGREAQLTGDAGQRGHLVRLDQDELRRRATGRAAVAGDVRALFAPERALHLAEPRREVACGQLRLVARRALAHRGSLWLSSVPARGRAYRRPPRSGRPAAPHP